jgi:hypothetical protein
MIMIGWGDSQCRDRKCFPNCEGWMCRASRAANSSSGRLWWSGTRKQFAVISYMKPVGADNAFTSYGLRILEDQAAEPGASPDADFVVGRRHVGPAVGWLLAEGPVRPVGVVVVDILAEDVVEMSPAGDEGAVGALAPRAGDPALADRVRSRRPDRRGDDPHAGRDKDRVEGLGVLGVPVSDQELQAVGRLPRSMSVFRACCTVQAAVGWAVTPARWTRRRWCSMTNST